MPRDATSGRTGFIWLPRESVLDYDILINGESVRVDVIDSEWIKGVVPEPGSFMIKLINADSAYSDKYEADQEVELQMDFSSGTTNRFKGKIDSIMNKYDSGAGYILEVSGGHFTSRLMEIHVTASFEGSLTCDEILVQIVSDFLDGTYTTTNVSSSFTKPIVKWDNKPFLDCLNDLAKVARSTSTSTLPYDAYLDDDKDFHFFEQGSVVNNDEAIVWSDTLITAPSIGSQILTKKDNIQVIGDDGTGLPVLYTSGTGTKEKKVFDTSIINEDLALELADATYSSESVTNTEADDIEALILPTLQPGDKIWYTNPPMKVTEQLRVYLFKQKLPIERTLVTINQERKVKQIFKKRIENELASTYIKNPYLMKNSINFTFDDLSKISTSASNVIISEGKIRLTSGSQGGFTSNGFSLPFTPTSAQLLVVGNAVSSTDFKISFNNGVDFQEVPPNASPVPITDQGNVFVLEVLFQDAITEIDSIAVLYK